MKNIISFLLLIGAFALISASLPENGGYKVGDKATDFSLKNVDGNFVSLKDYPDAKGYIVVFTCNTCPVSQAYENRIIELHKKYTGMGYPVIAINPNDPSVQPGDSYNKMVERANDKGFDFPYLFDAGQMVFPQYGATKTPHVFLLNKALIVKYIGAIDDNSRNAESVGMKYVENAIQAMEAGKDPEPNFTKAVGCSIKVKR